MNFKLPHEAVFVLLPIFLFSLVSCSDPQGSDMYFIENIGWSNITRATINTQDNSVKFIDVVKLASGLNRTSPSELKDTELVHCIIDDSNDTLLYAINLNCKGWAIFSSDNRIPPIVFRSNKGNWEEGLKDQLMTKWIYSQLDEMKYIRMSLDNELNLTPEEIDENKRFWKSISHIDEIINDKSAIRSKPEIRPDLPEPTPWPPIGHYEYSHSYIYEVVYDSIGRMIKTNWHQGAPYNAYCPKISNGSDHAPAGSVAIAAAQILYFLHFEFGIPEYAPSEAYCFSSVNDSVYNWGQSNYNSSIWLYMDSIGKNAAPLIADIGRRVNMKYGNNFSIANIKNLVSGVFSAYKIKSEYKKYDVESLKRSLLNKIPVIIEAKDKNDPGSSAFIVDRYQRSAFKTTNVYKWVFDNIPEDKIKPYHPDSITYYYSTPYIDQVGMNWGRGSNNENTYIWNSLLGEWRIGDWPYNFNENRKMICIDTSDLKRIQN